MEVIKKSYLIPYQQQFYWTGIYKKLEDRAKRVTYVGPVPPCHEFSFDKGNVGQTAAQGIRRVIADVKVDQQYSQCFLQVASEMVEPVTYEGKVVGVVDVESDQKDFFQSEQVADVQELAARVAPLLVDHQQASTPWECLEWNVRLLEWINQAKNLAPDVCDWIGVYFKSSYWLGEQSSDLVLGPYLGKSTEHVRIPLERGLCGRAIRDEQTLNVGDVRADSEYLACSLEVRSELVIPLRDKNGEVVAELDIDSDKVNAFSVEVQRKFEQFCGEFVI